MKKKVFVTALVVAAWLSAAGVQVELDATKIGSEDTVDVTLVVEGIDGAPQVKTGDFEIRTSSQSSQIAIVNGSVSKKNVYSFSLGPTHTGKLSFQIIVGDQIKGPYEVEVVDGKAKPQVPSQKKYGDDSFDRSPWSDMAPPRQNFAEDEALVRNEPVKTSVRLGEPVVVNTVLYTRVPISSIGLVRDDEAKGITFENISDFDRTPHQVQLGEKTYQAQVIRSRLVIPGLIGKHDIRGGVLRVEKAGGFWGGPARNIAIPEVSLQALPFPEKGKPVSFRNAVGEFQILMTADSASVRTHDPVMVRIEVSGSGNFKMLILPQVPVEHQDLTVKRASLRESYKLNGATYAGKITAEYFLIPKKDGTYKVPDLEWSYFSPEKSDYVTLRAPGFSFRADGGAASTNRSSEPAGVASYEKLVVNEDLLFIKTPDRENWDSAVDLLMSPWSLAAHATGLLLFGLGFFSRRIRFAKGGVEETVLGRAVRALRVARTEPGLDGFYEKIESALQNYVVEKFGLSGGLSLAEMKTALAETMDRHPGLAEILGRVKQCQTARYAPDRSTEIPRHWVDENENLLTLLDRELSLKEDRPG